MKKTIKILTTVVMLITVTAFTYLVPNWNIEPNYFIKFSGGKAEGTFSGLKGTIHFDPKDLANSKIDVTVDVNTINTGNTTKDGHAKNNSWFDANKYPTIRFISTSISETKAIGILEMHGTKKEISIPYTYNEYGNKATFKGNFKVNRRDYGIKGNMMGFMVGDEFEVTLNIPVIK